MPRMIDLIRASAVPSNLMQSAARGALSVPPQEMIEILVFLTHNKVFAEKARMTLAGWDETSSRAAAADSHTPKEVLDYLIAPENLRPVLVPALLENPSVSEEALAPLAASGSREIVEAMLKSARVSRSETILTAVNSNPNLNQLQITAVEQKLSLLVAETTKASEPSAEASQAGAAATAENLSANCAGAAAIPEAGAEALSDEAIAAFLAEHATEIAAEATNRSSRSASLTTNFPPIPNLQKPRPQWLRSPPAIPRPQPRSVLPSRRSPFWAPDTKKAARYRKLPSST